MTDDLKLLEDDIERSLKNQQPELVLDRLHTFTVKIIKGFCEKNSITVYNEKKEQLPLHSMIGMLVKYYKKNNMVNEFSEIAIKQSISIFEKFNDIRNKNSFAHDNVVLLKDDAIYVINTIMNMLNYIVFIETGKSQYVSINVVDADDLYRYICLQDIVTTKDIANNFNIPVDKTKEMLMELFKVDRLIRPAFITCDPDDEMCKWSRYY